MEGTVNSSTQNFGPENQEFNKNSPTQAVLQHNVDNESDGNRSSFLSEQSKINGSNPEKTIIKVEHGKLDIPSVSTICDRELDATAVNLNQDTVSQETLKLPSNVTPTIKLENEDQASTSHADDDPVINDAQAQDSARNSITLQHKPVDGSHKYKCLHCDTSFRFKSVRDKHMLIHSEKKNYCCIVCGKAFKRKYDLNQHRKIHKKEKGEQIDKKRKPRVKSKVSESHTVSSERMKEEFIKNYHQNVPSEELTEENINEDSANTSEGRDKRFDCPSCSLSFSFHSVLQNHLVIHSEDKPFVCPVCPKSFKRKSDLVKHKKIHPELFEVATDNSSSKLSEDGECAIVDSEEPNFSSEYSYLIEIAEQTPPDCNGSAGDRPFKCSFCDLTFQLKSTLKGHIITHSTDKPYRCSLCNKGFKKKYNLAQHGKTHGKIKTSSLRKRGRPKKKPDATTSPKYKSIKGKSSNFSDQPSSVRKLTKKKDIFDSPLSSAVGDRPYQCPTCNFAFRVKTHLARHLLIHSGERPHECPICKKRYKRKDDMIKHGKIHGAMAVEASSAEDTNQDGQESGSRETANNQDCLDIGDVQVKNKTLECGIADKSVPPNWESQIVSVQQNFEKSGKTCSKRNSDHPELITRRVQGEQPLDCSIDHSSLKQEHDLRDYEDLEHEATDATNSKQGLGKICSGSQAPDLDESKRVIDDDQESDISGCKVVFSQLIKQSGKPKWHVCTICNKSYIREADLKMHHKKTHEKSRKHQRDERPHKCSVCSMAFRMKGNLKIHMLKHSEEKPFQCDMCKKAFKRKYDLDKHKAIHARNRRNICNLCGRVFKSKQWLEKHMKYHERENSLQCSVCQKVCLNRGQFLSHLKAHKKSAMSVCPLCGKSFSGGTNLKQHLRRHKGEKPFKCTICIRSFVSKGELMRHVNSHTREKSFMCDICGSEFTLLSSLRTHARIHSGVKPFLCSLCPKTFNQSHHLKVHLRSHLGDKPYKCPACDKAFSDRRTLRNHLVHHPGYTMPVGLSNETVKRESGVQMESLQDIDDDKLDFHNRIDKAPEEMESMAKTNQGPGMVNLNQNIMIFEIPNTTTTATNPVRISQEFDNPDAEMDKIMRISKGCETDKSAKTPQESDTDRDKGIANASESKHEDLPTYSSCNVSFNDNNPHQAVQESSQRQSNPQTCSSSEESDDDVHEIESDREDSFEIKDENVAVSHKDENPCICASCDESFSTIEELEMHMLEHSSESGKPFSCKICKKSFVRKADWQKHKYTHWNNKHTCSMCDKEFKGKRWLQNHMKFHDNETPLQCAVCKKTCHSKVHFISHIKGHKKVPHKVCSVCGKAFTSGNNLKQHLRRHQGEKPFKCTICTSSFVSKGEMMRHVNSHTREKSYMCDICGNEFTLLSSLRTHARIHTGVKPFKCTMCPKSFVQSHHLKTHMRSHLGDKPYKCVVCEKSFSDRRTLRNHSLRHTVQNNTSNAAVCNNSAQQSQAKILPTPHNELLNLNFDALYCEN